MVWSTFGGGLFFLSIYTCCDHGLEGIIFKVIFCYVDHVYEGVLWRSCMQSSMLVSWLMCMDNVKYNVNNNVRDKVWSTWLIMLSNIVELPLPIWPLYEYVVLYMLGVPIEMMNVFYVSYDEGVWSRIPKGFICEKFMIWGYCERVVIPWREVNSTPMLLLLYYCEDQYVHTHSTCITMIKMCLWCQLKG